MKIYTVLFCTGVESHFCASFVSLADATEYVSAEAKECEEIDPTDNCTYGTGRCMWWEIYKSDESLDIEDAELIYQTPYYYFE